VANLVQFRPMLMFFRWIGGLPVKNCNTVLPNQTSPICHREVLTHNSSCIRNVSSRVTPNYRLDKMRLCHYAVYNLLLAKNGDDLRLGRVWRKPKRRDDWTLFGDSSNHFVIRFNLLSRQNLS